MNKNDKTIYWHDYETFGQSPQYSGVAQFAGIRTDEDLNIIGEPDNILCRLTPDRLPSPEACMITNISPLENNKKGMTEVAFFEKINKILSTNNTCGVGYNSLSFDDEVTRNGLYRNFIDPYEREWKNGCSRWDLLDVLRMVEVIKPGTFVVPRNEEGKKSFKLDQLSPANGIEHENAHDALADVYALIYMAKIIKEKEPELFNELYNRRTKAAVGDFLFAQKGNYGSPNVLKFKPFLMASSFFGSEQEYVDILFPISTSGNDVYCVKITKDIDQLLTLTSDQIKENLYTKKEDAKEEFVRLPIHKLQINKCPVMLPSSMLTPEIAKNLNFDGGLCKENIAKIKANLTILSNKLNEVFKSTGMEQPEDVDGQIYGGFASNEDKKRFQVIKKTQSVYLIDYLKNTKFDDDLKIKRMLFRYICRNFEDALDQKHYDRWKEFCKIRIEEGVYSQTFEQYFTQIEEFKEIYKDNPKKIKVLDDMIEYGNQVKDFIYNEED